LASDVASSAFRRFKRCHQSFGEWPSNVSTIWPTTRWEARPFPSATQSCPGALPDQPSHFSSCRHVADRFGRRDMRLRLVVPTVAAIATATTLCLAFAATPAGPAQLVLILAGAATATAAVGPAATVVIDVVEPGLRATATPLYVLVQNLFGLAVGPVLAGALADRWGLTVALAVVPGLGVVAAVALWWASGFYASERNALAGASPG
jgi:hypothetical protein